ncbi:MAG: OsmC family protein [Bacteroidetes bacterium]|nr:OsmC family protein [Bacteroidota bacterium]
MLAKVIYKGELRTEATHLRSGTVIETDAPVDNKGKGERFSPTDMVAVALATCILTTIGIAAQGKDINIDGAACEVVKIMVSDPRRIGEIQVNILMPSGRNYSDKDKQWMQHVGEACPVARSLHPDLKQTVSFIWQ